MTDTGDSEPRIEIPERVCRPPEGRHRLPSATSQRSAQRGTDFATRPSDCVGRQAQLRAERDPANVRKARSRRALIQFASGLALVLATGGGAAIFGVLNCQAFGMHPAISALRQRDIAWNNRDVDALAEWLYVSPEAEESFDDDDAEAEWRTYNPPPPDLHGRRLCRYWLAASLLSDGADSPRTVDPDSADYHLMSAADDRAYIQIHDGTHVYVVVMVRQDGAWRYSHEKQGRARE